jgi:hypothetical protein
LVNKTLTSVIDNKILAGESFASLNSEKSEKENRVNADFKFDE